MSFIVFVFSCLHTLIIMNSNFFTPCGSKHGRPSRRVLLSIGETGQANEAMGVFACQTPAMNTYTFLHVNQKSAGTSSFI